MHGGGWGRGKRVIHCNKVSLDSNILPIFTLQWLKNVKNQKYTYFYFVYFLYTVNMNREIFSPVDEN